jgi:hypothetical protein
VLSIVQFLYLETLKVFKEGGQDRVGIPLVRICDSSNTICVKTLITWITVTVPASKVPAADVFGIGIFH